MSMYRCAACGSPNVVTDTQKEGYSYTKGVIGTAVFGIGGAVAGINGKTVTVYKCPDCGLTLNYSMPFEIKTLIDVGVSAPASRKNLQLNGVPIDWKSFTSKYRNIEKDTVIVDDSSAVKPVLNPESDSPALPAEERELNRIVYNVAKASYISECMRWLEECKVIRANCDAQLNQLLEEERTKLLAEITAKRDALIAEHSQKKQQYSDEKRAAEIKLAGLGFFQLGEKNDTKKRIEQLTQKIHQEDDALKNANDAYEKDFADIKTRIDKQRSTLQKQIKSQNPLPLKPQKPKGMLAFKKDGSATTPQDTVTQFSMEEIFRYIEQKGSATYAEIKENCICASGMTDIRISAWITALQENKEIHKDGQTYKITVAAHPDWASHPRVTQEDWGIYETFMQQEAERLAELERKRRAQFADILDVMQGKGEMTAAELFEIMPKSGDLTTQTLSVRLNQMAEQGIITKTFRMRRSYFKCK